LFLFVSVTDVVSILELSKDFSTVLLLSSNSVLSICTGKCEMLLAQLSSAPSIWIAARWVNDVIEQVMLETEQEQTKEKERERQQARINERLASYDDRLHTWLFGSRCKL